MGLFLKEFSWDTIMLLYVLLRVQKNQKTMAASKIRALCGTRRRGRFFPPAEPGGFLITGMAMPRLIFSNAAILLAYSKKGLCLF